MENKTPTPERILVFAYGTLRPSLYPGRVKGFDLKKVGDATLYGNFAMLHLGGFPGLVKTSPKLGERTHPDGGSAIVGEVVETNTLAHLDRYEGYPSFYGREQVEVIMEDGRTEHPWVYIFNGDAGSRTVVTSGNWADAMPKRD